MLAERLRSDPFYQSVFKALPSAAAEPEAKEERGPCVGPTYNGEHEPEARPDTRTAYERLTHDPCPGCEHCRPEPTRCMCGALIVAATCDVCGARP